MAVEKKVGFYFFLNDYNYFFLGAKHGKELQLSKKEQILKANRDALNKKKIESDKTKIIFATQVKAHVIFLLFFFSL